MYYDVADNKCPPELKIENLALFESYEGPPQKYKAPQSTKKKQNLIAACQIARNQMQPVVMIALLSAQQRFSGCAAAYMSECFVYQIAGPNL